MTATENFTTEIFLPTKEKYVRRQILHGVFALSMLMGANNTQHSRKYNPIDLIEIRYFSVDFITPLIILIYGTN